MKLERTQHAFEDFVEATCRIHSRERLFEVFIEAMSHFGFDRVNFSIKIDNDIPQSCCEFGIISTYPDEWQRYYAERGFIRIDPVWRCASSACRPFTWSELERKGNLSPRQQKFLRQGEDAGLCNGIGIPFRGPRMQIAGVALATSERRAPHETKLDLISAFCHQFYEVYKRLIRKDSYTPPRMAVLSVRECEILAGVARGLSNDQISEQMNISTDTVAFHLKNTFLKLEVNNRVAAVVAGLTLGLIDL